MNGIVLSAGLGSRLLPYTETTPKPAIPFMTVPLACYPLSLFEDHKIHNLLINTHHLPQKIEALFQRLNWPCSKLVFSPELEKILGSGGGVRQALPQLLGRKVFFVANADEVILPFHHSVIKEALAFHKNHGGIATILCIQHPEVGGKFGGLWVKDKTEVTCFSKTPVAGHKGLHFVGVLLLSDSIEKYFFDDPTKEENILYDTLTSAIRQGEHVHAFEIEAQWFETGNPQDFLAATEACMQELNQAQPARWAEILGQIICRYSWDDYKIENDRRELKKRMVDRLLKLKSGN